MSQTHDTLGNTSVELGLNFKQSQIQEAGSGSKGSGSEAQLIIQTFTFPLNLRWLNKLGFAVTHQESITKDEGKFYFSIAEILARILG